MKIRVGTGILAGSAAAAVFAGFDCTALVLGVGGFWLSTGQVLGSVILHLLLGAVVGGLAGLAWALIGRARTPDVISLFKWMIILFTFLSLTLFCWTYLYDYGLGKSQKGQTWHYATAVLLSLVFAVCVWLLIRFLIRVYRRKTTAIVLATLTLVAAVLVEIFTVRYARPGVLAAGGTSIPPGSNVPNIVLLVMDTTRLDALSCYGNPRNTTPHLDRLAAEGLIFTRAYAPASWTPPSHASMFTGLHPSRHGTFSKQVSLKGDHTTVAEALSKAGYETFFLSYKGVLREAYGWNRGFHHSVTVNVEDKASPFYVRLIEGFVRKNTSPTPLTIEIAVKWLDSRTSPKPFFLFVNVSDPHSAYVPREPFFSECIRDIEQTQLDWNKIRRLANHQHDFGLYNRGKIDRLNDAESEYIRCLYDSEANYQDRQLSRLFERLRLIDQESETVAIVTSDHGELLGEHRLIGHSVYLFDELIHVPLIVWGINKKGVVHDLVSLIDLFPTILDMGETGTGRDALSGGVNLLEPRNDRLLFAESWGGGVYRKAAIDTTYKYIWDSGGDFYLFDVSQDPGEHNDLSDVSTEVMLTLHEGLASEFDLSIEPYDSTAVDGRSLKILKSLGYVQ